MVTNILVFLMESPFQFVTYLSPKHMKKMEDNRGIDYKILKYVKVPSPGYRVVLTICTANSLNQKILYKVSISNYPLCFCPDFKFMKSKANKKCKWLLCKHLYFQLQEPFAYTKDMSSYTTLDGLLTKSSLF